MATINVTDRNGESHTLTSGNGGSLMETLRDEGMGVEAICGGQCACATCHCLIDADWFPRLDPPDDDEKELLEYLDSYDSGRSRLTCQITMTEALDGISLEVAPEE